MKCMPRYRALARALDQMHMTACDDDKKYFKYWSEKIDIYEASLPNDAYRERPLLHLRVSREESHGEMLILRGKHWAYNAEDDDSVELPIAVVVTPSLSEGIFVRAKITNANLAKDEKNQRSMSYVQWVVKGILIEDVDIDEPEDLQ